MTDPRAPEPASSEPTSSEPSVRDALRRVRFLAGLGEDDLARLEAETQPVEVAPGQRFIEEGAPGEELYFVLSGELEARRRTGRDELVVGAIAPGEIIGEISVLEGGPRSASVVALAPSRLLRLSRADFARFLAERPNATVEIVRTALARLRNTEAALQQREKMAALGTLAAGLTHELNNPAAAVRRAADQLADRLGAWDAAGRTLGEIELGSDGRSALAELSTELARAGAGEASTPESMPGSAPARDPLAQADAAEALELALDGFGVDDAWELAPPLADHGWTAERVQALADRMGAEAVGPAVRWFSIGLALHDLLGEVRLASGRISELVGAVKSYSHLDRAPVQEIDVTTGLESTLVMLRHKLKDVEVVRDYAPDLPRIEGYAGELNQVWTNLIDNAIDAMDGHGRLELHVRPAADRVVVEICDSGAGIPEDVREHVFEPFFTTKPVGVGSGLGLHIVYGIVVRTHGGAVHVASEPGRTCFAVGLPLRLAQSTSERAGGEGAGGSGRSSTSVGDSRTGETPPSGA